MRIFICLLLLTTPFSLTAQTNAPPVTHYFIDDHKEYNAEDYPREAEDPAKANATFWQVQLYPQGTFDRDSAWGAISGADWKPVLDQYYRELGFEQSYQRLFKETPPQFKERSYTNSVAPVAVRIKKKKKVRQFKKIIEQLPEANGQLNQHIDFFISVHKTIEDNPDVLMSHPLQNQLKNYAADLMRILKNFRTSELQLMFEPNLLLMEKLIRGDFQEKGGIAEALTPLDKMQPVLQEMVTREFDPNRPIPVEKNTSNN